MVLFLTGSVGMFILYVISLLVNGLSVSEITELFRDRDVLEIWANWVYITVQLCIACVIWPPYAGLLFMAVVMAVVFTSYIPAFFTALILGRAIINIITTLRT
jgi:hypothetical protein